MSAALKKSPTNCDGLAGGGKFIIIFNVFFNECMVVFKVCIAKKRCPCDFNVVLAINQCCAQNYVSDVVDVLLGVLSKKKKILLLLPAAEPGRARSHGAGLGGECHKATSKNFMSLRWVQNHRFYLAVC